MSTFGKQAGAVAGLAVGLALICGGQGMPAEVKAKVDVKARELQSWSTDPNIVAAVKESNTNPSAAAKEMTNDKWKSLTLLDPFVRSFTKNALGEYLKTKKTDEIAEIFVSAADGSKVAFLAKTSSWTHKGKDKHQVPMTGRLWIGPMEMDDSSGQMSVQVGLAVLDGGKPVGSVVVGLAVAKLK